MSSPNLIRLLPDHVANKIAAGEVVERPASVLKELLENALDAGATQLEVSVLRGGRSLLQVVDNGKGMSRDDALMSVERHATSKIRDVDDIENIRTMGFRGEALAAIASVSRFELITRLAEEMSGTRVAISAGKIQQVDEAGSAPGTSITVRNLFFNVPARRKFLRTESTELSHVRQMFVVHALAHPGVGFRLVVEEKEIYRLASGASLDERLRELFGADLLNSLKLIEYAGMEVQVKGYAGLPRIARGDRSEQYVFVNGRPASAPVVGYAIREAYHTVVPKGRHPVLFLFIETDPAQVDVNVHPTKKEIRFRRSSTVRDAVMRGLADALRVDLNGPSDAPMHIQSAGEAVRSVQQPTLQIADLPTLQPFAYPTLSQTARETMPTPTPAMAGERGATGVDAGRSSRAAPWTWCRVLGQAGGLYVVLETDEGLVLMDPHAAHERVLYERFMSQVIGNTVKAQGLLVPEHVALSPQDLKHVRKNRELLQAMGFGISEFGGDSVLVDALPSVLGNPSAVSLLGQVAHSLEHAGVSGGVERFAEERVAQAACKAAVKANDFLKLLEIEQLVVDLAKADMPYTCPHGRPTIIFMSFRELDRKFGREH